MAAISEERRIEFTRKLLELRDDVVDHLSFPSDLTNTERKFLHKISQEYGLKSKSAGKGDNRYITVRKQDAKKPSKAAGSNGASEYSTMPLSWIPDPQTVVLLSDPSLHSQGSTLTPSKPSSSMAATNKYNNGAPRVNKAALLQSYAVAQEKRRANREYSSIQAKRQKLPAFEFRDVVLEAIRDHQIVLISGETGECSTLVACVLLFLMLYINSGCGKSTQVPQYLLDDEVQGPGCRVAITQPRRISAIAVAERIAAERSEPIGDTIGYNIRLESEKSDHTQVLFMTPGVLLRKLQGDPLLQEFTHVFVDEAHERDRFTEFLLIILRDVCLKRADLKVVLMSATMHTDKLRAYFGDIPAITVGGSVFPVQEFFLENVLQVTDFLQNQPFGGGGGGGKKHGGGRGAASSLNAAMQQVEGLAVATAPQFTCSICDSSFHTPIELGTHAAFCFNTDETRAKSNGGKSNNSSNNNGGGGGSLLDKIRFMRAAHVVPEVAPTAATTLDLDDTAAVERIANSEDEGDGGALSAEVEEVDEEVDEEEEFALDRNAHLVTQVEGLGLDITTVGDVVNEGLEALLAQYQLGAEDAQVDCDLVVSLLQYVFLQSEYCAHEGGSVLVFLPGWEDISRLHKMLLRDQHFGDARTYTLIQLHSSIPKKEQAKVFLPLRRGEHKIILSTNIAETSITIDDVSVVVNAGRVKEKTYDPHTKLEYLKSSWISQASARQRKGRAGRTSCGVCFHLYSRLRSQHLSGFQDSELLRMPLEELVLQAKTMGVAPGRSEDADGVKAFLMKAMDPPHPLAVANAIQLLQSINCMDDREELTLVGQAVSQLPMNPRMGRMILLGCLCGVGPSILSTAAVMTYRDPFVMPVSDQQRVALRRVKKQFCAGTASDQMCALRAVEGFQSVTQRGSSAGYRYCDDNFLSYSTLDFLAQLMKQLRGSVQDVGIKVQLPFPQRFNNNVGLLMAIIGTGLYPDVGVRRPPSSVFTTEKGCKTARHPSCVAAKSAYEDKKGPAENRRPVEVVGFEELIGAALDMNVIRAANFMMLRTTPVSIFSILATCGAIREVERQQLADDDDSSEEEEVVPPPRGRGKRGPAPPPPLPKAKKIACEAGDLSVVVEIDGWLVLKVSAAHLDLVLRVRERLAVAMVDYVRDPLRPLPAVVARGVDKIAEALSIEQSRLLI